MARASAEPVHPATRVTGLPLDLIVVELEIEIARCNVRAINDNDLKCIRQVNMLCIITDKIPRDTKRVPTPYLPRPKRNAIIALS